MGRPSFTYQDYVRIGNEYGLEYLGGAVPPSTTRKATRWKCRHCARELVKSLHSIQFAPQPCRCRAETSLKEEDYNEVATKLGIEWVARTLPLTSKHNTFWRSADGRFFAAAYSDLAYRNGWIPPRFRRFISKRLKDNE